MKRKNKRFTKLRTIFGEIKELDKSSYLLVRCFLSLNQIKFLLCVSLTLGHLSLGFRLIWWWLSFFFFDAGSVCFTVVYLRSPEMQFHNLVSSKLVQWDNRLESILRNACLIINIAYFDNLKPAVYWTNNYFTWIKARWVISAHILVRVWKCAWNLRTCNTSVERLPYTFVFLFREKKVHPLNFYSSVKPFQPTIFLF